ncbi:MAG: DNA translocase FtsK [Oscillospiraceae bacterium]|nr:DNA translocase FtsK [Oscillospiraceae bacterium]
MAKTKTSSTKSRSKAGTKRTARSTPPPPPPKKNGTAAAPAAESRGGNGFGGVIFLLLSVFSVISYFNTDGSVVEIFSSWLRGLLGWGFYLAAPAFAGAAILLFTAGDRPVAARIFAVMMLPVLLAGLSDLLLNTPIRDGVGIQEAMETLFEDGREMKSGGVIGGLLANFLNRTLSIYGAMPILLAGFLYSFVVSCWGSLRGLLAMITRSHNAYVRYERTHRNIPKRETLDISVRNSPKIVKGTRQDIYNVDIPLGEDEEALDVMGKKSTAKKTAPAAVSSRRGPKIIRESLPNDDDMLSPAFPVVSEVAVASASDRGSVSADRSTQKITEANVVQPKPVKKKSDSKKTSQEDLKKEREKIEQEIAASSEDAGDYVFPPLSLLRAGGTTVGDASDEIAINRERLEEAIRSFGISAGIVNVIRGPTVTRYDIELDRGVKLARITNLAGDLALSLGVENVRIAPIPDKISTVGIEVPNRVVSTVFLRDIIDSSAFSGAKSRLSFALGKDIGGNCIVGNISRLPHLLIAGTTGSGKSVCMNSLILSLLYKSRPDEVKLVMVDPKMVELGIYNGIPHLYVPVVTDPKKAAGALQWSVVEMMKRYRSFSELGVRDLDAYNRISREQGGETLPRVVIVIDELADLMLVAAKDVEESICRVAQMGRAAGMHLVIATQRPSADVITGLMKANIPSRIAFAVSSALESRIILDQGGAEKLIGFGDMLYAPLGSSKPTRIQGSFVTDEEREAVINYIREHNSVEAAQNSEIEDYMMKASKDKESGGKPDEPEGPAGDYDEMLSQAADVVLEMGSCSVSMLQRRLKLGYSRAARVVDQLEELGIVGPYEGAKPRSVTIDRAGWQQLRVQLGYAAPDEGLVLAQSLQDGDVGEDEDFISEPEDFDA